MNSESTTIQSYLKLINQEMIKMVRCSMQKYDLTKSQIDVLRILRFSNHPLCQKDIQDLLHVTNPTVTGLLNRLESKGFIRRVNHPFDHRIKTIEMTDLAMEFDHHIQSCIHQVDQTITKGLTNQQIQTLKEILPIILKNIEGGDECASNTTSTSKGI